MTLGTYLKVLRERWKAFALVTIIFTGFAVLVTALTPKVYTATVQVFIAPTTSASDSFSAVQAAAYVSAQVQTYASIVTAPDILDYIRTDTGLPLSDAQLKPKITATAPVGETLVDITVTDSNAQRAADIANSAWRGFRTTIQGFAANGQSTGVRVFLTSPATVPPSPSAPKPLLNIGVGLLLGLAFGAAFAIGRDLLDNRIKEPEVLAKTAGAPMMGVVVDDPKTGRHPIATRAGTRSIRAENYRQIRTNLQFVGVDVPPRTIAVTSSVASDGKSIFAINLASTLAEAGFTVCLIDADLRRPTIAKTLGLVGAVGLTNFLIRQIDLSEAMQTVDQNLSIISSGPTPPNPSEVLASVYLRDAVKELLDRVDYVILDTAPLLPVADGAEVAAIADGTLLVARHGVTTDSQVKRAVATLKGVDARLLGLVLNRVPVSKRSEYGYSYAYDRPDTGRAADKRSRADV